MDKPTGYQCKDCKRCTVLLREYYMVLDEVWAMAFGGCAMLCIGCLEHRLGRTLTKQDFQDFPINCCVFPQSDRLRNRLATGGLRYLFKPSVWYADFPFSLADL